MKNLSKHRSQIRQFCSADQDTVVKSLMIKTKLTKPDRDQITTNAVDLVKRIRAADNPGLMEVFLAEYGLSTDEGMA